MHAAQWIPIHVVCILTELNVNGKGIPQVIPTHNPNAQKNRITSSVVEFDIYFYEILTSKYITLKIKKKSIKKIPRGVFFLLDAVLLQLDLSMVNQFVISNSNYILYSVCISQRNFISAKAFDLTNPARQKLKRLLLNSRCSSKNSCCSRCYKFHAKNYYDCH